MLSGLVFTAGLALLQGGLTIMNDFDHHDMWGWGDGWGIVMFLMMIVFWGAVAALIVWVIRQADRGRGGEDPLEIAKRRLARGDITEEEFERIRRTLS